MKVADLAHIIGCTRQFIYLMLWEGRVPGAYQNEKTGAWIIPDDVIDRLSPTREDLELP